MGWHIINKKDSHYVVNPLFSFEFSLCAQLIDMRHNYLSLCAQLIRMRSSFFSLCSEKIAGAPLVTPLKERGPTIRYTNHEERRKERGGVPIFYIVMGSQFY